MGPPAMTDPANVPPRRSRLRDPIVCDENSQHGAAGTNAHAADPAHTSNGAEIKDTACYTALGGAEEFLPDTATCTASTATTAVTVVPRQAPSAILPDRQISGRLDPFRGPVSSSTEWEGDSSVIPSKHHHHRH